jgi:hypothetical protein
LSSRQKTTSLCRPCVIRSRRTRESRWTGSGPRIGSSDDQPELSVASGGRLECRHGAEPLRSAAALYGATPAAMDSATVGRSRGPCACRVGTVIGRRAPCRWSACCLWIGSNRTRAHHLHRGLAEAGSLTAPLWLAGYWRDSHVALAGRIGRAVELWAWSRIPTKRCGRLRSNFLVSPHRFVKINDLGPRAKEIG